MTSTENAQTAPHTGARAAFDTSSGRVRGREQGHGRVLLATDGHTASDAAFIAASLVAERLHVGVEVFAVVEPYPIVGLEPITTVPTQLAATQLDWMSDALRRRLGALTVDAASWKVTVRIGRAARAIAEMGRERDASVIVMGLGQHRLRDRLFGGERTLQVLRLTDRPVLAVGPDFSALPRSVVVAMDFSPASVRAARAALLVVADGGRVVLVHVRPRLDLRVPLLGSGSVAAALTKPEYDELVALYEREGAQSTGTLFANLLGELRQSLPAGAEIAEIETQTCRGTVTEELLRVADEVGADLLATGTQTHATFERAILGSVATGLVRAASGRAVLCAPPPDAAEATRVELRLRGSAEVMRAGDWAAVLDAFTRRNTGRRARLEVDDPAIGAQVQQTGYAFLGAAYDDRDERVELMLGDPADGTRHLTRSISRVSDVAFHAMPDGRDHALRVLAGRSQTLLTFTE